MIFGDCDNTMMNQNPSFVGKESDFDSLFSAKLQNWVDACLTNSALKAPGEAGLAVQKMIDGVYRSATAGQQVAI
jgi:predicted dehydrogenase